MTKQHSWLFLMAFLAGAFLFTSCGDDDESTADRTVAENLADDDRFSDLVAALERTGLTENFTGETWTVFAPTNAAFEDAGIDVNNINVDALRDVLLYHAVFGQDIPSDRINPGETYIGTALAGPDNNSVILFIRNDDGTVTIGDGAGLVEADIESSNGVIHAINKVLSPPNVVEMAQQIPGLSSLVGALVAAPGDLPGALSADGPFTVFAPSNQAFADIQSTVDGLTPDQLASVLQYHVVSGNVRAAQVPDASVTTLNGQEITLARNGDTVSITDSTGNTVTVSFADVQTTNGVIHFIDEVLIPAL